MARRHVVMGRPASRRSSVAVSAFFSFLAPKAPKADPRAGEIVDNLVDICTGTDAGAKASDSRRAEIEELVRAPTWRELGRA